MSDKTSIEMFDISRPLNDELAEWPGDAPFHFESTKQIAQGDVVNLGKIDMSVHNGTHADGWFHFDSDAETVDRVPLENRPEIRVAKHRRGRTARTAGKCSSAATSARHQISAARETHQHRH